MQSETTPTYRPRSDDAPHVFLFFLAASFFILAGGLDMAVRPHTAMRPGSVHLACLAAAGLAGAIIVFEVRPIVLRSRAVAVLVVIANVCMVGLRVAGLRYPAPAILCFCISALLAASAVYGMRGPQWRAYLGYVADAAFLAF